ncbi:hypothetical protein Mal15_55970 [Stieleria maiorica]|uniref:Uncharacterized protein n=1 Tax=Stieleria maiorica TaxID=2795974 RepID=A0A5B9MM80_9BACT|nr:hypothetical protein [Stieleria maiorica]QEG01520.1 hypothetical protein Mal15_55970 [Stieleria maiorica]
MFHSIITILTTAAVALHAMLGCCAHHDHSCCETHGLTAVIHQSGEHCHDHDLHGHEHHHHGDADSSSEDTENDCGHQQKHDGGQPHGCDEGDCSFTSVLRTSDLELMLTFSMWCQSLFDVAHTDAMDSLVALNLAAESPPDPLSDSGTARAISQVWRL